MIKRSSDLTLRDALRVYNAMSYSMWKYGIEGIMTSHIIIVWRTLKVEDHQQAADILSEYLNLEKKKWQRVRLMEMKPCIRNWLAHSGFKLNYIHVCENGTQQGLHTHILATIPWIFATVYKSWSQKTLTRLSGQPCTPETIEVVAPQEAPSPHYATQAGGCSLTN
jgi:hypothetical protein